MIYPNNAGEKLGFLDIKELIKLYCLSPMGREMVDKIQVMHNYVEDQGFRRPTGGRR